MAAESSWSLRGVDPRAREIARSAAKREGITIGEWLNRQLLEDGEDPADNDRDGSASDPEALAHLLDRLSRRIEAAEHRSTLAITGIDQSVLGVISRLQSAEELQSEFSQRYNTALNELRQTQSALQNRIAKVEREGGDAGGLEALKSLEEALSKLANQVYDSEAETRGKLEALRTDIERASKRSGDRIESVSRTLDERLADVERKVDADLGDVSETVAREVESAARKLGRDVTAAVEKTDKGLRDLRQDLDRTRADVEAMVSDRAEAGREQIESLESAVGDMNARLGTAERVTDRAIKALEQSFADLDARVKTTEERLESFGEVADRDAFAQEVEARFADLSRELADSVSTTRAELAAKMAQIASDADTSGVRARLDDMSGEVKAAERRQRDTLERISGEVAKLAAAVEARVRKSEAEVEARIAEAQESADAAQAAAADAAAKAEAAASSESSDEIVELRARIADVEAASSAAADEVARKIESLAAPGGVDDETLNTRIRESEARTREMVDSAIAGVSRKVENADAAQSPTQRALETLRARLEALETGPVTPAPVPTFEDASDLASADAPEILLEDAQENDAEAAEESAASEDDVFDIELELDDAELEDAPAVEHAAEADDPIEILETEDTFDIEYEAEDDLETKAATPDGLEDLENFEKSEYSFTDDDLAGGGSDDDAFDLMFSGGDDEKASGESEDYLRVARDAARRGQSSSENERRAGFGPVTDEPSSKTKKGRSLLVAAGGLAVLAVGAAGYVALRDAAPPQPLGGDADPLNDVFGAGGVADGSTGFAVIEPAALTPTASPFGEGVIEVDLEAATGPDFSLFAEGGSLFAPIEPEIPTSAEEMSALIERAIAFAPDAPAAPPVAPAPEPADAAETAAPSAVETVDPSAAEAAVETPDEIEIASSAPTEGNETASAVSENANVDEGALVDAAPATADASDAVTMQAAAEAGDPVAQFEYGGNLIDGGSLAEGVRLMRQAAENGLPAAQYRLAKLYETGRGVELDLAEARRWTERAANAGHRRAMHNLGIFYAEGRGAPQDFEEAGRWFEEAALFGATDSQFNLAVLYEQGLGVEQSLPDAYAWFSIAARSGDEDAAERAIGVGERLTPQARDRADEAVRRFSPRPIDEEVNGVFRDTPWSNAQIDTRTSIARAQAALSALGYEPGPADGLMGGMTRSAIESYQASIGLEPTGEVDAALVEKLEADVAAL